MLESGDGAVASTKGPNTDLSAASLKSFEDTQIAMAGRALPQTDRTGINVAAGGGSDYQMLLGNRDAQPQTDRTGMNLAVGGGVEYPVVQGNPKAIPPEYPGGIGSDINDTRRAIGALGPEARMMFELFERTYNSRAGENYLPSQLPLKEIDPDRKANIVKWELMGDSQLYQPKAALGGRDLKPVSDINPGSSKNPGHMYAIGYNRDGLPSDVLEYYRDTTANKIVYRKQYQFDYHKMPDGNPIGYEIDVKELFAPGETRSYGMHKNIAGIDHTLGGITKWYESPNSKFIGVEQFSGWQMDKARLQMNFNGAAVETSTIKQDGSYNRQSFIGPSADRVISQLSPNFYFFDLFGPPKQ
jgi:hypothetical protein